MNEIIKLLREIRDAVCSSAPVPDWRSFASIYLWRTQDANGDWWGWRWEPRISTTQRDWCCDKGGGRVLTRGKPNPDWRNTKERRPEPVAEPDWTPPPWELCPHKAKWLVLQPDGRWLASETAPEIAHGPRWLNVPDPLTGLLGPLTHVATRHVTPLFHVCESSQTRRPEEP